MSDPALVDGVLSSVQRSRHQRATMKRSVSVEELPTTKSQVIAKRRRKQKPKSKVPAQLLGDQSGSAISGDATYDEIFDAVISQVDEDTDDIDVDDDVHDSTLVGSLKNEIVELRGTIHQLQAKVNFLLSFVGITEPATTSSGTVYTSMLPTTGSSSEVPNQPADVNGGGSSGQVTFADIARRPRPPTLNPSLQQAVVSAVYSDFAEHDRRSRNIVISGLSIASGVNDKQRAENLLKDEFAVSVDVVKCRRLGRQQSGRIQPLLAVLPSVSDATHFIENARRLRYSTDPLVRDSVYINADLTKAEALAAYTSVAVVVAR